MKRFRGLLILLFAMMLSAASFGKPVLIKGELKNTGTSKYIYLYKYFGTEALKFDSAANVAGTYQFKYNQSLSRGFYRIGINYEMSFLLILGDESPIVNADLLKLPASTSISESKENKAFDDFRALHEKYNQQFQDLDRKRQMLEFEKQYNPEKYATEFPALNNRHDSVVNAQLVAYGKMEKENGGLYVNKLIRIFTNQKSKESFFGPEDYSDPELVNGDVLYTKITVYFQRFVEPNLDAYKSEGQALLSTVPAGSPHREVFYMTLIKIFLPYDKPFARTLTVAYNKEYPNSLISQVFMRNVPKGPPVIGDDAPDITLSNPQGKIISLSSLKGKVVLIDFWASWCGPCRRENPNVVAAYDAYKEKGFTVFSVSLDNNKDNWVAAIKADNLKWENHVSDLKGWQSQPAGVYGVQGIPATFLIDQNGKIVGTNLRGPALEEKLKELLK